MNVFLAKSRTAGTVIGRKSVDLWSELGWYRELFCLVLRFFRTGFLFFSHLLHHAKRRNIHTHTTL